ncbi:hypothetical protein GOL29_03285 [Sinorhizobium medicae]|nr:hypothetical protein [Sinorhizobium medicae]
MPCKIETCEKKTYAKGFCQGHYNRLLKYGDPTGGKPSPSPKGSAEAFYRNVVIKHESNDCLIWPYSKAGSGYGFVVLEGNRFYVHRLVCEMANGLAPTPKHQAAHACGNSSCVNPSHLSWKTRKENEADKLIHGTHHRGSNCPTAKLSEADVLEIRRLKGVKPGIELARDFNVSRSTISHIHTGKSWFCLNADGSPTLNSRQQFGAVVEGAQL